MMPRIYPRCDEIKKLEQPSRVPRLEPKSCLCKSQEIEEIGALKTAEEDTILHENEVILTPKVSLPIIAKPEVRDVEISIFLERIISLFGTVMKKLELAAALPILLADPEIPRILTEAEMKIVRGAFDPQNVSPEPNQSVNDSASLSSSLGSFDGYKSSESTCSAGIFTPKIYQALQIMSNYTAVREKVKSSRKDIAPQCHLFLQHMKYFIEHCVLRIRSSPVEEKLRQVHFRQLWHENHRAQQDIAALMRFLEAQRSNHHNLLKAIDAQYQKDFGTVEKLNRKCVEDIKSTINRSERKQIFEHKSSEMRLNDLSQYLAISKNKLENLREMNLRLEQEVRSKRFKVSSQLLALITKFDTEVGERYQLLEQLTDEFEADRMKKEDIEEEMRIQLEIYNGFVEERQQTIFAIFRDKYEKFVRNRSAKVIQRWWRPIFRRLKLKKKKRKKTKKVRISDSKSYFNGPP